MSAFGVVAAVIVNVVSFFFLYSCAVAVLFCCDLHVFFVHGVLPHCFLVYLASSVIFVAFAVAADIVDGIHYQIWSLKWNSSIPDA